MVAETRTTLRRRERKEGRAIAMDETAISDEVRSFIVDSFLDGSAEGFDDETDLLETGLLDSFSVLELATFLGERFSGSIGIASLTRDDLATVRSISARVRRALEG